MAEPKVTILIPNYKTLELTKLCLRLIRKHTNHEMVHVIVIDNDSRDDSLEYLRTLTWLALIERKGDNNESPSLSHSRALDLGLERVKTPYVLSIHTDTLVKDHSWLNVLISEIEKHPDIAGVGSWKLEPSPSLGKKLWKNIEFRTRAITYRIKGKHHKLSELEIQKNSGYYSFFQKNRSNMNENGKDFFYLRSHCALYRMDLIKKHNLTFAEGEKTAGSQMHRILVEKKYQMIFLPADYLSKYLVHLNHATMVLHPELGAKARTVHKGLKKIKKELKRLDSKRVLKDDYLDY